MKKITFLFALIAFLAVNVFGTPPPSETVTSSPTWDGSNQIDLCLGGSFIISIASPTSGHTYNLTQAGSRALLQSIVSDGTDLSFDAVTPVLGSTSYSVFDATDYTPFINFTTSVVAQPTPPTMTKSPDQAAVCAGTDVLATIASGGSGGVTGCTDSYEYSTNGGIDWATYTPGTSIPTSSLSGTDVVQIMATRSDPDGRGCDASNLYKWTVNALPNAPTAGDVTACYDGTTYTGSATVGSGEVVDWYDAASGGNSTVAPSGSAVGTYTAYAEARVTATGCVSASRTLVTVTINALPNAPTGNDVSVCYDGNTYTGSATVGSGEVVDWYDAASGGNSTVAPSGSAVGTYTAYAEARVTATGCVSASRTLVTVTIKALPDPTVSGPATVCANATETYTTEAGKSNYSWSIVGGTGTSTTASIDVTWDNTPGTGHSVTATYTDGNSCAGTGAAYTVTVEGPVQNTTTGTYYCTIQDAIIAASSGDAIAVAAGTFVESGQIVIDKDLSINGAGIGTTIVKTDQNTGNSGDARGWWLVNEGISLDLSQLTLDGTGYLVYQGIRHRGGGTIDYVEFTNIKYNESGPTYSGLGVAAFNNSSLTLDITNCEFSEIGRVGVLYYGSGVNGSDFIHNTYTGKGTGDWLDYGVEVGGGASGIVITDFTVSLNKGVASVDGSTSAGILATTYYGTGTAAIITDCDIHDNTTGIAVGYDVNDGSDVTANNNDIYDNDYGITSTASQVDAENNWWGDASGPSGEGPGTGDTVSTHVDFCPWLDAPIGSSPSTHALVKNVNTGEEFCTIQDAIDAATTLNGHTIQISAGTYPELVALNKELTLTGAGEGLTILDGTGLGTGNGITLSSSLENVTIENLSIQNYTGSASSGSGIFGLNNDNFTLQHVTLDNNQGRGGIYLSGSGAGIDNVLIDDVTSSNHSVPGSRGIVIWNGYKTNITITNCEVFNNNCCGIELQDGTSSNVTVSDNNVHDNADNGIGLLGMTDALGACLVDGNTVADNGRFGIEIKNPNGGVTVSNNTVSLSASVAMNVRDHAGIAVFRRSFQSGNPDGYADVPNGVTVTGNTVSGYTQLNPAATTSEGFGIVVEGVDHTVSGNIIDGNDVGLQLQGGGHPNPNYTYDDSGDGDQSDGMSAYYFGRGNAPYMCNITVGTNTFGGTTANGIDTRMVVEPLTPIVNPADINGQVAKKVENTNTSLVYCGIQDAIDATPTVNGHTIAVSSATYEENVNINKSLSLGSVSGAATTTIAAVGGVGVTIASDDVVVDDFTITNPSGTNAIYAVDHNNIVISNNIINDIGTSAAAANVHAIAIVSSAAAVDNIDIINNTLSDINMLGVGGDGKGRTASAISAGWSSGDFDITDLVIQGNIISNVNSNTTAWPAGHGAYGILINHGTGTTGKTDGVQIVENEISDIEGLWAHGIGLEGNTPNAIVQNNFIDDLTDHKSPTDAAAVLLEDNAGAASVLINDNSFTNVNVGVWNKETATVDATCNWWGSTDAAVVAAAVNGPVQFLPFLTNGTDDDAGTTGFQPVPGSCDGLGPVLNTTQGTSYMTITAAVADANDNDNISVGAGEYHETDISIDKPLTVVGDVSGACPGPGTDAPELIGTNTGNERGFIIEPGVDDVTIEGFIIRDMGGTPNTGGGACGIWAYGNSSDPNENITIRYNKFQHIRWASVFFFNDGQSIFNNILVDCNIVETDPWSSNTNVYGIEFTNCQNSTMSNNTVTGGFTGLLITAQGRTNPATVDNISITGNTVTGSVGWTGNVGITSQNSPLAASIQNVTITDNTIANAVDGGWGAYGIRAYPAGGGTFGGTFTVNNNSIYGNANYGLLNQTSSTWDAESNWWGDASGPYNDPHNTCGTGDAVSGPVDFMPWWTDAAMTIPSDDLPVKNITQNTFYCNIQDAVVDATSGDEIEVAAGTYFESGQIVIDKNLTLTGADKTTTIIKPDYATTGGGYATTEGWIYVAPGVSFTLDGFTLDGRDLSDNPQTIKMAIQSRGELTVENCIVQNIYASQYDGRGIVLLSGASNVINDVSMNNIQRIGLHIRGNVEPAAPYATVTNFTYVGKGAGDFLDYGIEFGGGGQGVVGDVLTVGSGCNITQCYGIASTDGSTSAGILITDYWGTGTTAEIYSSVLTDNSYGMAIGYDAPDISVVTANNNQIYGNTDYGIYALENTVVDAENNWWGDASGPYNEPFNTCGAGNEVFGPVDFMPWWTTTTGTPSTDLPVQNTDQSTFYCSIQDAINDANTGEHIVVAAGTYIEQLHITTENLFITGDGAGSTVVESPDNLTLFYTTSADNYPIVFVDGVADVHISDLTIDGAHKGNTNYRFQGIGFYNAGGTLQNAEILNIMDTPFSGLQHGNGLYAFVDDGGSYNLTVDLVEVLDYQKGGLIFNSSGVNATVTNCTVVGQGATNVTAQNGIQFWAATGTVDNCDVSDNIYTGSSWLSTGMLILRGADVDVTNTTLTDNYVGIDFEDCEGTFDGGTITNTDPDSWDGLYVRNFAGTKASSNGRQKFDRLVSPSEDNLPMQQGGRANQSFSLSNTTITGHDKEFSWGVFVYGAEDATTVSITGCTITHWGEIGVYAYEDGGTVDVTANMNEISNNGVWGFNALTAAAQDATDNYWGDETGPYHDPNNTCGLGNAVSDNVDFYQWWDDAGMTDYYVLPDPEITCLSNQERCADETVNDTYTTVGTEFDPTVVDHCRPTTITNDQNAAASLDGYVFPTGTTTVTWTIEDVFGNEYYCVYDVTINALPDPVISGDFEVCAGSTGEVYSTPFVSGNSYLWNVSGGTISSGQGSNSITVDWADVSPGTVTVTEYAAGTFCSETVSEDVILIALPTPEVTGNATPVINSTEIYSTVNHVGYAYTWTVTGGTIQSGQNTSSITVLWPGTPGTGTIFVAELNLTTGCVANSDVFDVTITPGGVDISGIFTYHNFANTPLNGLSLDLMQGATLISSTTTDASGYYEFNNVLDGTYTIDVTTTKTPGGINGVDAGGVNYWFTHPSSIEHVKWNAGEVNTAGDINATDAGDIQNYFLHPGDPLYAFARGEWTFWKQPDASSANPPTSTNEIIVSGTSVTQGFYGMSVGDFNGTFTPGAKLVASDLMLTYDGSILMNSSMEFELPIKVTSSMQVAALSLILEIPSQFVTVEDVLINNGNVPSDEGSLGFTVNGDELRISWNNIQAFDYSDGNILLTLKLRTTEYFGKGDVIEIALSPSPLNELADGLFNVIDNVVLSTYSVEYSVTGIGELELSKGTRLESNPNPFNEITYITYSIPVEGEVKLDIYNMYGSLVNTLVNDIQSQGEHTIRFHALGHNAGIYTAILHVRANDHVVSRSIKIVLNSN